MIHKKAYGSSIRDKASKNIDGVLHISAACGEVEDYTKVSHYWSNVTCEDCLEFKDERHYKYNKRVKADE